MNIKQVIFGRRKIAQTEEGGKRRRLRVSLLMLPTMLIAGAMAFFVIRRRNRQW